MSDRGDVVEGLTLERYAKLAVALFDRPESEHDAIAQAHGVAPGRLAAAIEGWQARMRDPQVLQRYNTLYQEALVEAGVQRPDVSLEQYAAIMKELSSGADIAQVCRTHGMTVQQWAMVSQHWVDEMGKDPSVAMRFTQLMGYGGAPPPAGPAPGGPGRVIG